FKDFMSPPDGRHECAEGCGIRRGKEGARFVPAGEAVSLGFATPGVDVVVRFGVSGQMTGDTRLDGLVVAGHADVLAKVLGPGGHHERLQIPAWPFPVVEDPPSGGAVPTPHALQLVDG